MSRSRRASVVRWTFLAVVVGLLTAAVVSEWHAMRPHFDDLSVGALGGALLVLIVALLASMMSWRALLSDLGSPLPIAAASRVFFVSQLAKYVPGSVWPIVVSMDLGRDHDIPRQRSATAGVLVFPINVVVALSVGIVTLPFAIRGHAAEYAWVLIALPPCVALLHPRVLRAVLDRVTRVLRRAPVTEVASVKGMASAAAWSLVATCLSGLHVYLLASALGATGRRALFVAIGAWAIGWVVGFLLIPFPGGIGPRELALVRLLRPVLATGAGAVLVIASRLLFTIAEVLVALCALVATRRRAASKPT